MATGVGRNRICWTLFSSPPQESLQAQQSWRKTPLLGENLGDISYTSQVIADFVSKFVAVATGVGIQSTILVQIAGEGDTKAAATFFECSQHDADTPVGIQALS